MELSGCVETRLAMVFDSGNFRRMNRCVAETSKRLETNLGLGNAMKRMFYLGCLVSFSSKCSHSCLCKISSRRNHDSRSTSSDALDSGSEEWEIRIQRREVRDFLTIVAIKRKYSCLVLSIASTDIILFTNMSTQIQSKYCQNRWYHLLWNGLRWCSWWMGHVTFHFTFNFDWFCFHRAWNHIDYRSCLEREEEEYFLSGLFRVSLEY